MTWAQPDVITFCETDLDRKMRPNALGVGKFLIHPFPKGAQAALRLFVRYCPLYRVLWELERNKNKNEISNVGIKGMVTFERRQGTYSAVQIENLMAHVNCHIGARREPARQTRSQRGQVRPVSAGE